jgi:hypothetical protein
LGTDGQSLRSGRDAADVLVDVTEVLGNVTGDHLQRLVHLLRIQLVVLVDDAVPQARRGRESSGEVQIDNADSPELDERGVVV